MRHDSLPASAQTSFLLHRCFIQLLRCDSLDCRGLGARRSHPLAGSDSGCNMVACDVFRKYFLCRTDWRGSDRKTATASQCFISD